MWLSAGIRVSKFKQPQPRCYVRWMIDDSIERQINRQSTWNHSDGDEELSHSDKGTRTTDPKVWDVRPDNDGILPIL